MVNTMTFKNRQERLQHLASLVAIPSINPKDYDENGEYQKLDFIRHERYGVGFVESVVDDQTIEVFFTEGVIKLKQKSFLKQPVL